MNSNEIMIKLALDKGGDWAAIYAAIKNREPIDVSGDLVLPPACAGWRPITILDPDYPEGLKKSAMRPPFVIWAKGDPEALRRDTLLVVGSGRPHAPDKTAEDFAGELEASGLPILLLWHSVKGKGESEIYLDRLAKRASAQPAGERIPVSVLIPASVAPKDANRIAAAAAKTGGCAITERIPGAPARVDPSAGRLGAALCKAAVVTGGKRNGGVAIDAAWIASTGWGRVGALAHDPSDPNGELCLDLLRNGAAMIADADDLKTLMEGVDMRGAA